MVTEATAKEIAGKHVEQIVGGPKVGYRVVGSTEWPDEFDITVNVWQTKEGRDNPDQYNVTVDSEGNITNSGWD